MIFKINLLFLCIQFLLELNNAEQFYLKEILGVSGDCDFDCQGRLEVAMIAAQIHGLHPMGCGFREDTKNIPTFKEMFDPIGDFTTAHTVDFHLFNRNHFDKAEVVTVKTKIKKQRFKSFQRNKKTKIIIHGWKNKVGYLFTRYLKRAYLFVGDFNLIMVDWSSCSFGRYKYVKDQIPIIANTVARFIDHLHKIYNLKPEDIHIIGHSLGAHIAGATGHLVTTGKIGRITGLDPANPLIDLSDTSNVLSRLSASFVDVIHTNSGWFGVEERIGHVDFFPNGGEIQPGCSHDLSGFCSHYRAFAYFAESVIVHDGFPSKHCPTWEMYDGGACSHKPDVSMGEAVPRRERGKLFLWTMSEMPFITVHRNMTYQYEDHLQEELDIADWI